ncbi:MAG: polysaccharide biosynthesis protein [Clostridia bacterium]|nr:polysaccharide biosynthesis protein [Clostridia bacterium]
MAEHSRTRFTILNTSVSSAVRIITILMGFITRMVFTRMLDQHYVGISGLFLDFFQLLSLSELGISVAVTYALYKPIADNDTEKQKSIMALYRRFYNIVALIVLSVGLIMFPFLDYLIKDQPHVDQLQLIYILYLINAVVSYLFVYKRTLIEAHQRMYISMLYYGLFMLLQYVLQIVILVCTKNFILYLIIYLLCTCLHNIAISQKANKLYPYLKEKDIHPISADDKQDIIKNIKAMFIHKIGAVVVKNTDSLLISSMIGIVSTACYSNYRLIIGSLQQILNQIFQGVSASIGNLGVTDDNRTLKNAFDSIFFIGFWVYGFSTICLLELSSPFIALCFGQEYVFSSDVNFLLCLNFYMTGIRQAVLSFRDSLGLFRYDRYKSIAEAIVNLIASIILTYHFGISGILLGTLISTVMIPLWIEPYILFKYRLHYPLYRYFVKLCLYSLVIIIGGVCTHAICSYIDGSYIYQLLIKVPVCVIIPNLCVLLFLHRTPGFNFFIERILQFIKNK